METGTWLRIPARSSDSSSRGTAAAANNSDKRFGGRRCWSRFVVVPFSLALLAFLSSALVLVCLRKVDNVVSRTKTVAGHNLKATPWHPFPQKEEQGGQASGGGGRFARASRIFHCSYLTCHAPFSSTSSYRWVGSSSPAAADNDNKDESWETQRRQQRHPSSSRCPHFFRWIIQDLAPWRRSRISASTLAEAQKHAAMRVVISGGRLYVDLYYACVQSRAMFTLWGLLQLLRKYPGMVPDVDLMFDCMDRPAINRSHYSRDKGGRWPPPPLFRYCTTREHLDIPFPDWSFWGWPEVNIEPWDIEFQNIKMGSQAVPWTMKHITAYWKGNPDVGSPVRISLKNCNDSKTWGAEIMCQDWAEESRSGFQQSKLSNQCNHRYKIYAEGYAWSVSLKYIIACGSLALIIHPQYEDFLSRGLVSGENYWPVSTTNLCQSIKSAVDWGNKHPFVAEVVGKRGQAFMEELNMEQVYSYMYHLVMEYSKLQDFKPSPPPSAQQVCPELLLCFANQQQGQFLKRSAVSPASSLPCTISFP